MGSKHPTVNDTTPAVSRLDSHHGVSSKAQQRANLALCLAPLLLLGATCAGAAIERGVFRSGNGSFGNMTSADACQISRDVFQRLNGTQPSTCDTSTQSAYSVRRHEIVREWSVLCSTLDGDYLLRINADTRKVYAINRMGDGSANAEPSSPLPENSSDAQPDDPPISHDQAEARARNYIGLVGIASRNLTPVKTRPHESGATVSEFSEPEWNFTFRSAPVQKHVHLVTISVRSKDGRLEHLWNPVLSL